jgi:Domain of unknown function (DUF3883)
LHETRQIVISEDAARSSFSSSSASGFMMVAGANWPSESNGRRRPGGDGTGYDVQSFNTDGSSRLIEVKTTGLGKYFPFNVTVNEVRCSQARPHEFHLYRVFNFGPGARLYMLTGELSKSCHLDPTQYRAFVQSSAQHSNM